MVKFPKLIKYIFQELTIYQNFLLFISIFFPLIFSILLFSFSEFFIDFPINEPITHITYWLFTTIFVLLFFGLLRRHIKNEINNKNQPYRKVKWNITDTLSLLLKNRIKSKRNAIFILILMILFFYFVTMYTSYILHNPGNNEENFFQLMYILIFSVLIFSTGLSTFFDIFAGFQDTFYEKTRYSLLFVIPFGIFFILMRFSQILESEDVNKFVQVITKEISFYVLVPVILFLISILINYWNKISDKRRTEIYSKQLRQHSWHTFFSDKFGESVLPMLISIFFFLFFLILFILESMENPLFIINEIIIIIILFLVLAYFLWGTTVALSRCIVKNLFDWNTFLKTHRGQYTTDMNCLNKLVKIKGECTAVCFSNTYKDNFPTFKQQFILKVDTVKNPIEVVRLTEASPFRKTIYVVKEGDKIKISGILRRNCKDGKITPILIAHHMEKI